MRVRKSPTTLKAGTYPAVLDKMTVGGRFLSLRIRLTPDQPKLARNERRKLIEDLWEKYRTVGVDSMDRYNFVEACGVLLEKALGSKTK